MRDFDDIIVAPATPTGGAIAIVRLSGAGVIELVARIFRGGDLLSAAGHTLHYGYIIDGERVIDDVLLSIFRAPHSYTAEDGVEISCHGSAYIVQEIINLTIRHGARLAEAGEFTLRAYLAGRMDLSQAEAIAEVIASSSAASLAIASTQMRGGYSDALSALRSELLELAALLELELDFSQEDVEFADRGRLDALFLRIGGEIESLKSSFATGNAIKNGVAVAIVGEPNVGKSTLLNRLLNEDRAMVSEIAGTTRDVIEEQVTHDGIIYRFLDTAGIHNTDDKLEQMGIERTYRAIDNAQIIIQLVDGSRYGFSNNEITPMVINAGQRLIIAVNKIDAQQGEQSDAIDHANGVTTTSAGNRQNELTSASTNSIYDQNTHPQTATSLVEISAKTGAGIPTLLDSLSDGIDREAILGGTPIVSSTRHYNHLLAAANSLAAARTALHNDLPTDLLCEEIRQTLHHIGEITGEITTNEVLGEIFAGFCIGK